MITCSCCGVPKEPSEFYPRYKQCKKCNYTKNRARVLANPEKHRAYFVKWRAEHRDEKAAADARWQREHPDRVIARNNKWIAANRTARRAHEIVQNEIDRGRLQRCGCEVCGNAKADAHHDDYSKPLDIRWLCRVHHKEIHELLLIDRLERAA